jgi:hypothetical protein
MDTSLTNDRHQNSRSSVQKQAKKISDARHILGGANVNRYWIYVYVSRRRLKYFLLAEEGWAESGETGLSAQVIEQKTAVFGGLSWAVDASSAKDLKLIIIMVQIAAFGSANRFQHSSFAMYLEYFIAGLTGFFLWWLIHHVRAFHGERKRQQAGQLVLEVKSSRWYLIFVNVNISCLFFAGLAFQCVLICMTFRGVQEVGSGIVVESIPFVIINVNCFLGTFLFFAYFSFIRFRWYQFIIYEHGIKLMPWGFFFIPWKKIKYCQWHLSKKKRLRIVIYRHFINPRYSILDYDSTASALCRYVEFRDNDGTVISTPPSHFSLDKPDASGKNNPVRFFPLQFDLSTLFLLMLFIASASSWYGYHFARSKPQRDAVAKLEKHQPRVSYYDVDVQSLIIKNGSDSLDDDDLAAVESLPAIQLLMLDSPSITDAGLVHLESAIHLKYLSFCNTSVTGSGFSRLQHLTQLQSLSFYGSPVSDEYLAQLQAFPLLQGLSLGKTKITDAGLRHLSAMPGLVSLVLEETSITGSGLNELSSLRQLQYLYLSKTNITDAGLSHLSAMPKLFELWLEGTNITDSGLKEFSSCRQLRKLYLSGTNITDAGVKYLKELPLEFLDISGTKITQKGFEELGAALPNAYIGFLPATPSPGVSPAEESSAPTEED